MNKEKLKNDTAIYSAEDNEDTYLMDYDIIAEVRIQGSMEQIGPLDDVCPTTIIDWFIDDMEQAHIGADFVKTKAISIKRSE